MINDKCSTLFICNSFENKELPLYKDVIQKKRHRVQRLRVSWFIHSDSDVLFFCDRDTNALSHAYLHKQRTLECMYMSIFMWL